LINPNTLSGNLESEIDLSIAAGLVDCLLKFLKGAPHSALYVSTNLICKQEPVTPEAAKEFFPDAAPFVERLQSLIPVARKIASTEANNLVCNCFAAILEASLQCGSVWDSFKSSGQCSKLFHQLLLADPIPDIRQGIADSVRGICCTLPT
jgi:ubiquitin carboxyl-terminal hydrolase 34